MRVQIQISVFPGDQYSYSTQLAQTEAQVVAEAEAMDAIPWEALCAGLAQRAIAEAKEKERDEGKF